jgi:hypothetical protein
MARERKKSVMNNVSQWTPEKWKQTMDVLLRRAGTDAAFRQKCLTAPRQAIKDVAGLDLPINIVVEFAEPKKATVITLPPFRANGSGELSDAQLEAAAGGFASVPETLFCCTA